MTTLEEAIYAKVYADTYEAQMRSRMSRVEFGDMAGYHAAVERSVKAGHNRATAAIEIYRKYVPKETEQ